MSAVYEGTTDDDLVVLDRIGILTAQDKRVYAERIAAAIERIQARPNPPAWLLPKAPAAQTAVGEGPSRLVAGGAFVHDVPEQVPAVWGHGDEVLWAEGEPLMITGPTGVGKTTLGGQLVAGRLGLQEEVLGQPVRPGNRVLYLAMDRPAQIARALGRLLRDKPRGVLDQRLVVWKGPPPADLARQPKRLLEMARQAGADTVVLDSLKDAASKLSDEEAGQGLNAAMQHCVAEGVEVVAYHHQRKTVNGSGAGKPTTISDVYGSAWLTAGCGSVVLLWGSAGDLIVELSHLKQPADRVGPWTIRHDHVAGLSHRQNAMDLLDLLAAPSTVREVAMRLSGSDQPASDAEIEAARRKLEAAVKAGTAEKVPSHAGQPVTYVRSAPTGGHGGGHG